MSELDEQEFLRRLAAGEIRGKNGEVLTEAMFEGWADRAECANRSNSLDPLCRCPCHDDRGSQDE